MRKLKGSQGRVGKLSFPFHFKLTWNGCRMFWSADAEEPRGGLSTSMTHGHASFGSPSSHLLYLHDHICLLQTRWASCLTTSLGARVPRTWVLISVPLDSVEKGRIGQLGPRDIYTVTSR
jgi:hypothetical protein